MRAIQKLVRQGNSAMITIPRSVLAAWKVKCGDMLDLNLDERGVLTITQFVNPNGVKGPSPGVIIDPPPGKM